jgi:poly(A) polymerase
MHYKELIGLLKDIVIDSPYKTHTYLVGGGVRDEILGVPVKDIDIVVDVIDGGKKLGEYISEKLGMNVTVFPYFNTAMLKFKGITYKGTTFDETDIVELVHTRSDKYHMKIDDLEATYGTKEEDVYHRDFTINTLYKDIITGEILDMTGKGITDIHNSVLRTTLKPDITFTEDPIRMLRAIRFMTKYNLKPIPGVLQSIKKNSTLITSTSTRRIKTELLKILALDNSGEAIKLMTKTGIIDHILPVLEKLLKLTPKV